MAVLSNTGIRGGASGATAVDDTHRIKRSARFNDDNAAYLNRTPGTEGNKKKWTFSWWMKNAKTNDFRTIFMGLVDGNNRTQLSFDGGIGQGTAGDTLTLFDITSGTQTSIFQTDRLFRDTSAWYHCVLIVDVDNGTTADKVQLWVNGERETFSTYNAPTGDLWVNTTNLHTIGQYGGNLTDALLAYDGYLADIHLIDGLAKAATDFAETDSTTGQWVPKAYTGTYGTNGFHLAMDPANSGILYSNFLTDSQGGETNPQRVFDGGIALESHSWSSNGDPVYTFEPPTPISYSSKVEIYLDRQNYAQINGGGYTQYAADDWHTLATGSGTLTTIQTKWGASGGHASLSAVRVDGEILVDHTAIGYDSSGNDNHWHENNLFGHEATVGNNNFKAITYEGNDGTTTVNVGFQPDLVWLKGMDETIGHNLYDSVRGDKKLMSDRVDAESAWTALDITSTGFTIADDAAEQNKSGKTYVSWCWKAGGAASSNSDGSGTSSVSANPDAGFSIVSYTGTGASATWGHGLGKEPEFIITKDREGTNYWNVYHKDVGYSKYLRLDTTAAEATPGATRIGATSTTTFTTGSAAGETNASDTDYIAYCWAPIEGYSKFGTYLGTGTSGYPNVVCGFTPAFILIKRVTSTNDWTIYDTARDSVGVATNELYPNTTGAQWSSGPIEITADGFKINCTHTHLNAASNDYIFAAFAGNPKGDLDLLADAPGAPYNNSLNGGGNYATLNPLDSGSGVTLSDGNLKAYIASDNHCAKGNFGMSSGKWYWEINITQDGNNTHGIAPTDFGNTNWCGVGDSLAYNGNNGQKYTNSNGSAYGATHATGDIIGTAFDADSGSLTFYKNGVSQGVAWSDVDMTKTWVVCCGQGASTHTYNFGQRAFAYTPPDGYKSLNTYNLPDPTITKGNTGFDTKLYDGNSGTQTITGLEFSPDLVWLKQRNATASHYWYDTVRGTQNLLSSNYDGPENWAGGGGTAGELTAFTSDGFTIVNSGSYGGNVSGGTFVVWNWDAGTANVSKSAGDLNSSLYDQSVTWSGGTTSSTGSWYSASYDETKPFQGKANYEVGYYASTTSGTDTSITVTFSSAYSYSSTVEVYNGPAAHEVSLNSGTFASVGSSQGWVTVVSGSGSLSTFTIKRPGSGSAIFAGLRIDGKLLVDNGVTLANVPSIATTYRANPNTGFSVVTATASSAGDTIAHGLNAVPSLIIAKRTNATSHWPVYHSSVGANGFTYLNLNNAKGTGSDFWNNVTPTSSVFTVGSDSAVSGGSAVFYCWSEVSGYSKFGTYEGNNNAVGPFVWCGFKPAVVMVKNIDAAQNWVIVDNTRDPDNVTKTTLRPNSSLQGYTNNDFADFLSNGFKFRGTEAQWNNSETYLFAAFAESPFKYSNAR